MNLADVFTVLFIIFGFLIVFIGYWLAAAGLFPELVERCSEKLGHAPVRCTLLGVGTMVPLVALGLFISSKAPNGAGKIAGLAVALIAILGALCGSAGLALRIGSGLRSPRDAQEPWRVLRGGIVLGLTFVMPFLGTFVVLPLALGSGFGAFVLTTLQRRQTRASAEVKPEEPVMHSHTRGMPTMGAAAQLGILAATLPSGTAASEAAVPPTASAVP